MHTHIIFSWSTFRFYHSIQSFWIRVSLADLDFAVLPCKSILSLSNCLGISCAQPSSGHLTDYWLDLNLDWNNSILKPWYFFCEAIPLLIWRCASGPVMLKRELTLYFKWFSRSLKVLCRNRLVFGANPYSLHSD